MVANNTLLPRMAIQVFMLRDSHGDMVMLLSDEHPAPSTVSLHDGCPTALSDQCPKGQ